MSLDDAVVSEASFQNRVRVRARGRGQTANKNNLPNNSMNISLNDG